MIFANIYRPLSAYAFQLPLPPWCKQPIIHLFDMYGTWMYGLLLVVSINSICFCRWLPLPQWHIHLFNMHGIWMDVWTVSINSICFSVGAHTHRLATSLKPLTCFFPSAPTHVYTSNVLPPSPSPACANIAPVPSGSPPSPTTSIWIVEALSSPGFDEEHVKSLFTLAKEYENPWLSAAIGLEHWHNKYLLNDEYLTAGEKQRVNTDIAHVLEFGVGKDIETIIEPKDDQPQIHVVIDLELAKIYMAGSSLLLDMTLTGTCKPDWVDQFHSGCVVSVTAYNFYSLHDVNMNALLNTHVENIRTSAANHNSINHTSMEASIGKLIGLSGPCIDHSNGLIGQFCYKGAHKLDEQKRVVSANLITNCPGKMSATILNHHQKK
ncbi:hypothetical protein BDQ17DRAFT_1425122 [Cyathus striatus]|nr:hypothetical protein BDQ17DRAFT_1425122 [Cyathus striatus]